MQTKMGAGKYEKRLLLHFIEGNNRKKDIFPKKLKVVGIKCCKGSDISIITTINSRIIFFLLLFLPLKYL